jgi:DNA-binding transcriptional LysR family regulator
MSTLDGIEIFVATVQAGSFAGAARRLAVTPSAVSRRVAALEGELGVQLLARTTRTLRLTEDGQAFHERCLRILEEVDEARESMARVRQKPAGLLRVDAPVALGRSLLTPRLPGFLVRYPEVRIDLTLRDQLVDPIAEGLDVLLRIGPLRESLLIARKLGECRRLPCASPAYVRRHGSPRQPRDLARHRCLGFLRDGRPACFDFVTGEGGEGQDGARDLLSVDIGGQFNANDADVLLQMALAGHGIVMLFDFLCSPHLATGALVPVLPDHPTLAWPIHALYPKNRHLLPKVRVFLDFMATLCECKKPARA